MTGNKKTRPPNAVSAANDNASDGTINIALHKFARLLGRQAAADIYQERRRKKAANDNGPMADVIEDKDIH